jgi:hypothetical protein
MRRELNEKGIESVKQMQLRMFGRASRGTGRTALAACLAALALAAGLGGCTAGGKAGNPADAPLGAGISPIPKVDTLAVKAGKRGDGVSVETEIVGDTAIVTVHSAKGIGGADVMITSRMRPKRLLFRFDLKGLEGLTASYAGVNLKAGMASAGGAVHQSAQVGVQPEAPIAADSPYWMPIRTGAYIEVEAPRDFLAGRAIGMSIDWVDFYR